MRIQSTAAAEISGLSVRTIQARAPEIPGAAKLFGRWTFDPVKLRRWLKEMEDASSCRATSTAAGPPGGGACRSPEPSTAAAYERAIGLKPPNGSRRGRPNWSGAPISGWPGTPGRKP
jgi:hypothetical protein